LRGIEALTSVKAGREFVRCRVGRVEVSVEDDGDAGAVELPVFLGSLPPSMALVVRIRLAIAWQRRIRISSLQAEGVVELGGLRSIPTRPASSS
jgi:hypothetical protein